VDPEKRDVDDRVAKDENPKNKEEQKEKSSSSNDKKKKHKK